MKSTDTLVIIRGYAASEDAFVLIALDDGTNITSGKLICFLDFIW